LPPFVSPPAVHTVRRPTDRTTVGATPSCPPVAPIVPDADLARARSVARSMLGCDHLAEDVLQDALVALWRSGSHPPEPRAWLVRAVVLRSRHLRRTLRRRLHHEHLASEHCSLHAGCDNPLHSAYAHELGEHLDRAIAALPEEQVAPFHLFECAGLDYAAIAAQLALPIGTVRSRLHRARLALQGALSSHAQAP
jgi:RNA polymerase sigma-70 factor (ECF subfamily)